MKRSMVLLGCVCLALTYFFIQPEIVNSSEIEFPTKPIKLIVNFSAGGPADICSRKLADLAGKYLNQEIFVENKPGAGGAVGVRFVAKSKSDGYTIGCLTASPVVTVPFFQEVDYDPANDFTPIIQFAMADHPLAVPVDSPIKTFKDFIEEGRKRQLTYASMEFSAVSISLTRMATKANIKLKLIPTGGTGPAVPMVLGGHTDAIGVSGVYEYVRSGKLRLICQTGGYRNKEFPEIPTLKELSYDVETIAFYGIVGPKGIPEKIQKKLEEAFTQAARDPSFAQVVHNAAFTLFYRNGEDFGNHIKEAYKRSEKELKELGLGKFAKEKK